MIYFTSDSHFAHVNILKYCNRPFDTIEEMDSKLIENWNSVVSPNDTVYHLGDVTLGKDGDRFLSQLNGYIRVLSYPYHHDKHWLKNYTPLSNVELISGLEVIEFPARDFEMNTKYKHSITLCHYEMKNWDRKHYNSWHLFGHDHRKENKFTGDFSMNIGVDANNFTPVSLEQVTQYMIDCGWSL